jgi:hypothetical protein
MMKHIYSYKIVLNKYLLPANHAYLNLVPIHGSKAKCNGKPGLKERCL